LRSGFLKGTGATCSNNFIPSTFAVVRLMHSDFITSQDKRWMQILHQAPHDFYHLPEYVSFCGRHEGGLPCAFVAQCGSRVLFVPLLMRAVPSELDPEPGFCDVLTPYGYPGPILVGDPSEETVLEILQEYLRACRERGIISSFWRLHPLLPFPLRSLRDSGDLIHHGFTVYIDLSRTQEQLWQETSLNHRRDIKALQKNGFATVRNDWRHWQAFVDAYRGKMRRVGAHRFYLFSDDYFEDLRTTLRDHLEFWTALSPEGDFAGAAVFLVENGIVQYHLGATNEKYFGWSPNKLIFSEVRLWAREAGHRVFHLGGGLGGKRDSLYTFKSRFSPLTAPFHTFRAIIMPDIYADLVRRHGDDREGGHRDGNDFFPAYRKPS
jgi:CelD/BcsL family acetyltransferase involved in cellulose biosynthesis